MFKKIEIWILYLVILFAVIFAVGFGTLVRQELIGSIKGGLISKTALRLSEIPVNAFKLFQPTGADFTVEDRFPLISGFTGTPNSQESYLLLSRRADKEGIVELVDLQNFQVLHTWNPNLDEINKHIPQIDEMKNIARNNSDERGVLLHPLLTQDGGLLFNDPIFTKIDVCSNLIYQKSYDIFHHSIEVDIEGNLWVPSRKHPTSLPIEKVGNHPVGAPTFFWDDAIVKLSPDGEVLYEKSVSQILIDNGMEYLLFAHGNDYEPDPIHLNDIQPVNFNGEYWKKGDVFLSVRNQSMIILFRPSSGKIIWYLTGPISHQHDVNIIDDHRISIFNNNSLNTAPKKIFQVDVNNIVDGNNEVVIYDFLTKKVL